MKKFKTNLFSTLILICLSFLFSCQKVNTNYDIKRISLVESWLDKETYNIPIYEERIDNVKKHLLWDQMWLEGDLENGNAILVVPLRESFRFNNSKGMNPKTNLIMFLNRTMNIEHGMLVQYSANDNAGLYNKKDLFDKIFNKNDIKNLGKYTFFSVKDKFLYEMNFGDKERSSSIIKPMVNAVSQINNSSTLSNMSNCTDWYRVTTTYHSNGTVTQTVEFLFTYCGPCYTGEPTSIIYETCDGSNGSGTGGGSGGSGGNNSGCDYSERSKSIVWPVHTQQVGGGYWQVKLTTNFKGKVLDCQTNDVTFTEVKNGSSFVENWVTNPINSTLPYSTWTQSTSVASGGGQIASANVTGIVNLYNGTQVDVTNVNVWMFYQVFPY